MNILTLFQFGAASSVFKPGIVFLDSKQKRVIKCWLLTSLLDHVKIEEPKQFSG